MTFRAYLQKVRMEKVCELLARTDKNIADISYLVGYSDLAFFYRLFKISLHMTPLDYRKTFKT